MPLLSATPGRLRTRILIVLAIGTLPLSQPVPTLAQEEVVPVLWGEVRVGGEPLSNGMVVLHQVSSEASGEIDSVRVAPDGSFRLRLPFVPDHSTRPEILFASVFFGGLHYFGPPITEAIQLDSLYLIQAFDTASVALGGADLPLSVRNLFLEKSSEGWEVTDVFQVTIEGEKTLYSPEEGVTWSYPLPEAARDFQMGQADLAPDAFRFEAGKMEIFSPLSPGERFFLIRYHISQDDFVLPLPGRTHRLEVMVREPAPNVSIPPLSPTTPLELEPGNLFRRFAGDGLVDSEVQVLISAEPWTFPAEGLGLLLAALLVAAGVYGYRRRSSSVPGSPTPTGPSTRAEFLEAVAVLDEEFGRRDQVTPQARRKYEDQRKQLLDELKRRS